MELLSCQESRRKKCFGNAMFTVYNFIVSVTLRIIKFKLIKCLIWVFWIFVVVLFISVASIESKKLIPHLVGQNLSSRYQ